MLSFTRWTPDFEASVPSNESVTVMMLNAGRLTSVSPRKLLSDARNAVNAPRLVQWWSVR